jgi:Na+/H+ antiporter NhaD/arsenite permease-like protein
MISAIVIFVLAYIAIATEKFPRHWIALLGAGLLIAFGVLSPMEALTYIGFHSQRSRILFLAGDEGHTQS